MPAKLIDFLKHIPVVKSDLDIEIKDKSSLEKIIILLRTHTGNDFSLYKKNTVYRRIERRMSIHKIDKISSYVHFLQENPKEVDILFKELMIGVTKFFRDANCMGKAERNSYSGYYCKPAGRFNIDGPGYQDVLPEKKHIHWLLFLRKHLKKSIHTGGFSLQIFATDLDNEAIEIARKGIFPANIAADVSPNRLNRFFIKTDDGYRVNTEIREMVVFAQHNIIMHPPFTKIDILSCRNLLIYMDPELQKKITRFVLL